MSRHKPMLRRKFIFSGILAVGGTVAGLSLYRSISHTPAEQALNEVVSKLARLPGAVRLGRIYRDELNTNNRSMRSLTDLSTSLTDAHGDFGPDDVGIVLDHQIQADLRTSQIYLIDGWYLTRTELDLCALAAVGDLTETMYTLMSECPIANKDTRSPKITD